MRFLNFAFAFRRSLLALSCLLAAFLAGCATSQTAQLLREPPAGLPRSWLLQNVPFYPGEMSESAPAALAMALNASGVNVRPEELLQQIVLYDGFADRGPTLIATALRHGRLAVRIAPRLDAVLTEIADGRPVIVLLFDADSFGPVPYYAVVRGYDLDRAEIMLNTAWRMRERLPLAEFEQRWWRGDFWGIVVVRPDRLPRTATPEELATATLALERFDGDAAQAAFDALAQRSIALNAWMELGTKEIEQGDPHRAVTSFTNATRIDPTVANAWRGLATALLALGQVTDAAVAARRALALGGPKTDESAALLKQIEARLK